MKIVVLGASSFSGRAFVAMARSYGYDVAELSRPQHDINKGMADACLDAVRAGYANVVNFVALNVVNESWKHAEDYYQTNVVGVCGLADALLKSHAPLHRFVQVSTPEVYGSTATLIAETAPFLPSTPYANSRAATDTHLMLLRKYQGFPVCFTRTVNVYGPGQQLYRVIPKTALCALTGKQLPLEGGGVSRRSFIHINDVARGILEVLENGKNGETYHMATRELTEIRALVGMVCRECGVLPGDVVVDAPARTGQDMAYVLDDSKIRSELGWTDKVSLEAGVAQTVTWVKANLHVLSRRGTEYRHVA